MKLAKLIEKEITIRLTEDGFVSKTRHATFFSTSDAWQVDMSRVRIEEQAASGSLLETPRNSDPK
jgi:hypothetical protein